MSTPAPALMTLFIGKKSSAEVRPFRTRAGCGAVSWAGFQLAGSQRMLTEFRGARQMSLFTVRNKMLAFHTTQL
ncbi:uncharacterized protein STEHIDRAFT_126447, partial [Stereum hirsutum FP-91666 SS1]